MKSKIMARKFSDLRAKMMPSAREKAEQHAQRMLAEIDEQRRDGVEDSQLPNQLANSYDNCTQARLELFKNESVKSLVADIKAKRMG